jgi:hypothetical protein
VREFCTEAAVQGIVECRPCHNGGKADASWEETGKSTMGTAGVRNQASIERSAEITPGRANFQQGLAITCKDQLYKGKTEAGGGFWSGA